MHKEMLLTDETDRRLREGYHAIRRVCFFFFCGGGGKSDGQREEGLPYLAYAMTFSQISLFLALFCGIFPMKIKASFIVSHIHSMIMTKRKIKCLQNIKNTIFWSPVLAE